MAAGEPESRGVGHVGGLELDEQRHQGLHRERPGRVAERQGAGLRGGQAAGIHVRDVQRAGEKQLHRMRRAGQEAGTLHEADQCHRRHRLRDGAEDPRRLLGRFAADAQGAEPFQIEMTKTPRFLFYPSPFISSKA